MLFCWNLKKNLFHFHLLVHTFAISLYIKVLYSFVFTSHFLYHISPTNLIIVLRAFVMFIKRICFCCVNDVFSLQEMLMLCLTLPSVPPACLRRRPPSPPASCWWPSSSVWRWRNSSRRSKTIASATRTWWQWRWLWTRELCRQHCKMCAIFTRPLTYYKLISFSCIFCNQIWWKNLTQSQVESFNTMLLIFGYWLSFFGPHCNLVKLICFCILYRSTWDDSDVVLSKIVTAAMLEVYCDAAV